jgi:hypothetical protein
MKKITKIIAAMALSVMLSGLSMAQVSVWDGSAEPWTHGSGTEEDPYLIESAANLAWLAQKCQEGSLTGFNFLDTYFLLTVDLDLGGDEGLEWMPIGGRGYSFSGNFDGGGHIIDNMYISGRGLLQEPPMAGMVLIGLFGKLEQGSIRNLTMGERCLLELNELTGLCYAGMLAGAVITYRTYWPDYFLPHLISNCHNRGSIQVTLPDDQQIVAVGGLVGFTNPGLRMEGCSNSGALSLEMPMRRLLGAAYLRYIGPCLGGLVGMDYDMYDGLLTYWDDDPVGPFEFVMEDCHNTGSLRMGLDLISYEARKRAYAGGIVGNAGYRVSLNRCSNRGDVTVTMRSSTGLTDYEEFLPFCSGVAGGYANDFNPNYGSHRGQFVVNITNCYNHAPVRCEVEEGLAVETTASGITGRPISESELVPEVHVTNCYHVGELLADEANGITPADTVEMLDVKNCYYREGDAPDNGIGTPMSDETMKTQEFVDMLNGEGPVVFYYDEWDVNDGYPVLDDESPFLKDSEWYYEIKCDDGSVYYQYLRCAGDTTVNGEKAKVVVRTNQIYDKEAVEVTREYLYEEDDVVYWWNKELEEFTVLYDFGAEVGDEWETKVGGNSITVHVDAEKPYQDPNTGRTYRMLVVSDAEDVFSGEIICGVGHTTSLFPEKLMGHRSKFQVDGLRCYWNNQVLVLHTSTDDCDAIYSEVHGVEEATLTEGVRVYPNPTDGILFIDAPDGEAYRITNVLGQTLMTGTATSEGIRVASLPAGIYFISIGQFTTKFIVNQ